MYSPSDLCHPQNDGNKKNLELSDSAQSKWRKSDSKSWIDIHQKSIIDCICDEI